MTLHLLSGNTDACGSFVGVACIHVVVPKPGQTYLRVNTALYTYLTKQL